MFCVSSCRFNLLAISAKKLSPLFSDSGNTPIILDPPDQRPAELQRFQKRQEIRIEIPIHCFGLSLLPRLVKEIELPQGFALGLDRDRSIATGGVDRNMAQPLLHHRDVDAGETQMGGRGVAPKVDGTNLFTFDARRLAGSLGQVSTAEPEKTGVC